jgi:integrase
LLRLEGRRGARRRDRRLPLSCIVSDYALKKALGDEWPNAAIAIHTGLRRGEQFGLRWENLDFLAGVITIPRSKSGLARRVPMNATFRDLLREPPSRLKEKWVFPSDTKKTTLDPKNFVRRVFLPALKEAKIEGLRWHDSATPSRAASSCVASTFGRSRSSWVTRRST